MRSLLPEPRTPAGFTSNEVLVVVTVVSVLIALFILLAPRLSSRGNARRQEAATCNKAIVNALENYRQDYGGFPPIGQPRRAGEKFVLFGDPAAGCPQSSAVLLDVLRAIPRGANAQHALNSRQVKYYENKKATDRQHPRGGFADGDEFAATIQGRFYDPWGGEYCILFETDDDESIDVSSIFADLSGPENLVKCRAAAFSLGSDGKVGGQGYEGRYRKEKSNGPPDDLVSWQ